MSKSLLEHKRIPGCRGRSKKEELRRLEQTYFARGEVILDGCGNGCHFSVLLGTGK